MPTITAVVPSSRRTGRFDVHADGRPIATISLEVIERLKLTPGRSIDADVEQALAREAALLRTYDRALNMLALRARSANELRRSLIRKGEPTDQVEVAVERLLRAGFLDDASFARQFARSRVLGAGFSRHRLHVELARRGVEREVASAAIDEIFADERVDEAGTLERVAKKKLETLARLDQRTQRRRLYAYLARRGYDSDDVGRVVRSLVQDA